MAGTIALAVMSVAVGQFIIPAHWTSICMDMEFSGWVAPIANRLSEGQQLYADGAHTPMAPLPYVLTNWLSHGHARWITETRLHYLCQSLAVLAMYVGFYRVLPWPAPLIAALALFIRFVSIPKLILYDALAQMFAALAAVLAMHALRAPSEEPTSRRFLWFAGAASAFCFLSKQSTGTGLVLGVALALWLPRAIGTAKQRLLYSAGYAASFVLTGLALLVILSPWIEVRGFVRDVLLTSTEVKGGKEILFKHLTRFASQIWSNALSIAVPPIVVPVAVLAWRALEKREQTAAPSLARSWHTPLAALGALLGSALCTYGVVKVGLLYADTALQALLFLAIACFIVVRLRGQQGPGWVSALSVFACVTVPAALAHSLSVDQFRWSYDNNPMIWVPVAFAVVVVVLAAGQQSGAARALIGTAVLTFAIQATTIGNFATIWGLAKDANRKWPEVPFLKGAFMRPRADGMRNVVHLVRELAPNPTDPVLLLPNDPNVEAWFGRPRPALTSAIIFADQYWDRYVDEDFKRLKEHPPRVIVIGPRGFWQGFAHYWQPKKATERLGARIVNELLPQHYMPRREVPIAFGSGDFMDVYVLKELTASAAPAR